MERREDPRKNSKKIDDGTGITRAELLKIGGAAAAVAGLMGVGLWQAKEARNSKRLESKIDAPETDEFKVSFEQVGDLPKPKLPEGVTEREFKIMLKTVYFAFEIYFNKLKEHDIPVNPKHVKRHLQIMYEELFKAVLEKRKKGFKKFLEKDLSEVDRDPKKYTEYMNEFLRRKGLYLVGDTSVETPHVGIYSVMTQERIVVNEKDIGELIQLGPQLWTFGKDRKVVENHPSNSRIVLAWPERKEELLEDGLNLPVAERETQSEELFEAEKKKAATRVFLNRSTNR